MASDDEHSGSVFAIHSHRTTALAAVDADGAGSRTCQEHGDGVVVAYGAPDPPSDPKCLGIEFNFVDMTGFGVLHGPGESLMADHLDDRLVSQKRVPRCSHALHISRRYSHNASSIEEGTTPQKGYQIEVGQ
jgi:hypothetical protein